MISFSPTFRFDHLSFFLKKNKNIEEKFYHLFCKNNKDKTYFFSRSSWAIASITLLKQNPCVFIPDFYCDEAIFLLRKLKVKIIFYKLNQDNSIDKNDLKEKSKINTPDIILYCNFFGKNQFISYLYDLKKKYNSWIIEDSTHNLPSIENSDYKGDFIIFSPYKILPIPMGSIMFCKLNIKDLNLSNTNNDLFIDSIKSSKLKLPNKKINLIFIFKWFLKQFFKQFGINKLKIEHFDSDNYLKSENDLFNPRLDNFSKKLMIIFLINSQVTINKRLQMRELIQKVIRQKSNSFSISKDINISGQIFESHPYMLEVNSEKKYIKDFYDYLTQYKIPVLTWPALPLEIKKKKDIFNSAFLKRNSKFYIPLHYQPGNFIKNLLKEKKSNDKIEFLEIKDQEWIELYNKCSKKNIVNGINYLRSQKKIHNIKSTKYKILLNNSIVGIFVLLKKNFLFLKYNRINRGPLFLNGELNNYSKINIIKKMCFFGNKKIFTFFKFSPEIENCNHDSLIDDKKKTFLFDGSGWRSSLLDLKQDQLVIRQNLSQKWRNSLNIFEKENIDIKEENSKKSIDIILNYYNNLQKQKNFKGIDIKFLNYFLNNSKSLIYIAYFNNEFLGYICISTEDDCGTYLLGYANERGRKFNVMNGLMWKAIIDLKKKNFSYLDLGGLDDLNTPGIFKFKSGINAEEYKLAGNFNKIKFF